MSAERKKKPVYQEHGADDPVTIDPPMKSAEEFDDLVGGDEVETNASYEEVLPPVSEKKIEVLPHGWKVIASEQQTGTAYLVSHLLGDTGTVAFWRKTRRLNHNRWVLHGIWSDPLTRVDIIPQPLYYKELK